MPPARQTLANKSDGKLLTVCVFDSLHADDVLLVTGAIAPNALIDEAYTDSGYPLVGNTMQGGIKYW